MGLKIKFNEFIGLELKEFRTKYQVKAKDIAELLNKSAAYVSKLEKGQIQQIAKDELVKITNFITKSEDGYYLFCEKIAEKANSDELEKDILLMNFDWTERKIPVTDELVEELKQRMVDLQVESEDLALYINQNEDLGLDFFLDHKIDPNQVEKNVWIPYQEADSIERLHTLILVEVKKERINKFISGKIQKCEYILPYVMLYHLLKISKKREGEILDDEQIEDCKDETEKILLKHKFYTLTVQAKFREQSNSEQEYQKILSEFDIKNREYIFEILKEISFLSNYDISYTNEKLKIIVDNLKDAEVSFALAYMAIPLDSIKELQPSVKREFLREVKNLVDKYSNKDEAGENVERY